MKAELTDADFLRLRELLHQTAGLVFEATRRDSLAYSIGERLPASGCHSVAAYLDLISGPDGDAERQSLLDEVTIPETYFFRNPPQIRALRRSVLPELVRAAATTQKLVIWSAGCSTGEEPYTVAMMLRELVPDMRDWDIRIVATDVSQRALEAARRGRYGQRSVQLADAETVGRWFDVEGADYVVKPEVRRLVQFRHHNLVTDPSPFLSGEVDLVLCRNVTIYFDRDTTRGLMGRFHRSLRDGGYLFLGHAETLWQVTDAFTLVTLGDAFVYRRADVPHPVARRRTVLPDRRTEEEPHVEPERRAARERRGSVFGALAKAPLLPFARRHAETAPAPAAAAVPAAAVVPAAAAVPQQGADRSAEPAAKEPTIELVSCELKAGRYAEAAAHAEQVAARRPLLAEAHYLRGMALVNLGRDRDALVNLRKAVYLDPMAGFAHFLLAGALSRQGEGVAAARAYRAAAETLGRRPGDAVAAELGGRGLHELIALCRTLAGSEERKAAVKGR